MTHALISTPFGRRAMSLGLIATQAQAREAEPGATVHKWKVVQAITTAKDRLGLPDRAIAVLTALLSFHQETTLSAGDPLVVFPSNEKLCSRAHGIAPATLRRHLAVLVEAGIIIRRDSPNGKRYARRGEGGAVADAFGFDLAPLVARAGEFEALAEAVEAEKKALRLARERVTLARRDVTKLIALGLEEGIPGDWMALHEAYLGLVVRLKRSQQAAELTALACEIAELASGIASHLESFVISTNPGGNESHSEQHKQNSNTEPHDLEPASREGRGNGAAGPDPDTRVAGAKADVGTPLGMVLEACPDILDYAGESTSGQLAIRDWAGFLKTAALVRAMLGISPDAWRDAVETMGLVDASIVIAAILQKGDEVRFPGGYLRALTEKKRAGSFSTGPILMALIRGRLGRGKSGQEV